MFQILVANWFSPTITLLAVFLMIVLTIHALVNHDGRFRLVVSWCIFLFSIFCGLQCIDWATESTKKGLEYRLSNLAKIMAVALEDAGHAGITLETELDDPVYVKIMNTMKEWMRKVPSAATVYTVRIDKDGNYYFITDPQTDLNRNGVIDEGEEDLPIGEPYDGIYADLPELVDAFQGRSGFNGVPFPDRFGTWVTAAEPMYDKDGNLEAVFGVDFWGDQWVDDVNASKFWPTLFYSAFLSLFFAVQFFLLSHQKAEKKLKKNALDLQQNVEQLVSANQKADAAVKAKDEFLANMSHEIRTPMNAILGMLHLVRRTQLTEKQACYLESAEQSTKLLLRVINDILDFSKIEAGKLEIEHVVFSLKKVFAELYGLISESARTKSLELEFDISEGVPEWLIGDSLRLSQVLINLIGNAIKFTEKGSVKIKVRELEANQDDEVTLRFDIRDTGIGMSKEQQVDLFRPFVQADTSTTRKYGGTGLGLAISTNLVKIMRGEIGCESSVGQGTLFYFTSCFDLPGPGTVFRTQKELLAAESATADYEPSEAISNANRRFRILLVEDNKINQIVAAELLTLEGFSVDVASNGLVALERLEKQNYDLVLMDIQMPVMDGIEATQKIRQQPKYADLPILAMTAHAMSSDYEKSLAAGMNDHITKPIDPAILNKCIRQWIQM